MRKGRARAWGRLSGPGCACAGAIRGGGGPPEGRYAGCTGGRRGRGGAAGAWGAVRPGSRAQAAANCAAAAQVVGEAEQQQLAAVALEVRETHFAVAVAAFEHAEDALHRHPHAVQPAVALALPLGQRMMLVAAPHDRVLDPPFGVQRLAGGRVVGPVGVHRALPPGQQLIGDRRLVDVGRGRCGGRDQLRVEVHVDVRLVAVTAAAGAAEGGVGVGRTARRADPLARGLGLDQGGVQRRPAPP